MNPGPVDKREHANKQHLRLALWARMLSTRFRADEYNGCRPTVYRTWLPAWTGASDVISTRHRKRRGSVEPDVSMGISCMYKVMIGDVGMKVGWAGVGWVELGMVVGS